MKCAVLNLITGQPFMLPPIKVVIRVIVVVLLVLFLLRAFGVADVPIPRLK